MALSIFRPRRSDSHGHAADPAAMHRVGRFWRLLERRRMAVSCAPWAGLPGTRTATRTSACGPPALPLDAGCGHWSGFDPTGFRRGPNSVNVSGARVSARTRTRSSGSKCAAISTNVTSAVAPATYFCSAMLTRTRPAPFGFIEPCLGGRMLENREAEVGSRRLASRAERGRRITSGSEAAIAQKRTRPVLRTGGSCPASP